MRQLVSTRPRAERRAAPWARSSSLLPKLAEAWFPGGAVDPGLTLGQVHAGHANCGDVKQSKLVRLYHLAKAVITGKPPTDRGEHAGIRMG